jgi:hypothetical protein
LLGFYSRPPSKKGTRKERNGQSNMRIREREVEGRDYMCVNVKEERKSWEVERE